MRRLLQANFARLFKDKVFKITMVIMVLYGIIACVMTYRNQITYERNAEFDSLFFNTSILIGIVIAAFCSLFLGAEYSDGTIRNKLVVGLSRTQIYLSNFLTCAVAGLIFKAACAAAVSAVGIPMFGFFKEEPMAVAVTIGIETLMIVALSAIFTMISMLIQNKSYSAIVCMLVIFFLVFAIIYLFSRLGEPEVYETLVMAGEGNFETQTIPNPTYPRGFQRDCYEFLVDILPTGQGLQVSSMQFTNPLLLSLYSIIIIVFTNVSGVLMFRKKDLK